MPEATPVYGVPRAGKRPEILLLICRLDSNESAAARSIGQLQQRSEFSIELLNVGRQPASAAGISLTKLQDYAGVVIHSSAALSTTFSQAGRQDLRSSLSKYAGGKFFLIEEEIAESVVSDFVDRYGIDLVLSPPAMGADSSFRDSVLASFDASVEKALVDKGVLLKPISQGLPAARHILLLCAHRPDQDPRIGWITDHAPEGMLIHVVGIDGDEGPGAHQVRANGSVAAIAEIRNGRRRLLGHAPLLGGLAGWSTLALFDSLARSSHASLRRSVGASWSARGLLNALLERNLAIVSEAFRFSRPHAIIAADLETLPAAVILKNAYGIPLVYDAHEFWPDSYDIFEPADVQFWTEVERTLLHHVDRAFTVSKPLAAHMSALYGHEFCALPNAEPLEPPPTGDSRYRPAGLPPDACVFLFQGGYMGRRGLEGLIDIWSKTDKRAVLVFRGPPSPYAASLRARASATGLIGSRIFFMPSLPERELVAAASTADVGLIPYEPATVNNRYCCPNKLSQYMAAGIPILHNRLEYVASVVREAGCGREVAFADEAALIREINALAVNTSLRTSLGRLGRVHYETHFNWHALSAPLYLALRQLTEHAPACKGKLFAKPTLPSGGRARRVRESVRSTVWDISRALWHRAPEPVRAAVAPLMRSVRRAIEH